MLGHARLGQVCPGFARPGMAKLGQDWSSQQARPEQVCPGLARLGQARLGLARPACLAWPRGPKPSQVRPVHRAGPAKLRQARLGMVTGCGDNFA